MKQPRLFLFPVVAALFACSASPKKTGIKYFEGCITYEVTFIQKTKMYDSALLRGMLGNSTEYCYKEGNERINTTDSWSSWGVYKTSDNISYSIRPGSDSLYWQNIGGPAEKILSTTTSKGKEKVLGILCDEIKVEYATRTLIIYYNSDSLRIDPEWHKEKIRNNEYFLTKKKNALSLKFIIENPDFAAIYTAVDIRHNLLDDAIFAIPKNLPLVEPK